MNDSSWRQHRGHNQPKPTRPNRGNAESFLPACQSSGLRLLCGLSVYGRLKNVYYGTEYREGNAGPCVYRSTAARRHARTDNATRVIIMSSVLDQNQIKSWSGVDRVVRAHCHTQRGDGCFIFWSLRCNGQDSSRVPIRCFLPQVLCDEKGGGVFLEYVVAWLPETRGRCRFYKSRTNQTQAPR